MDGHVGEKGKDDSSQSWKAEGLLLGLGENADHRGKFRLHSSLRVFNAAALSASGEHERVFLCSSDFTAPTIRGIPCYPAILHSCIRVEGTSGTPTVVMG